jgi:hypothetical protein
LIQQRFYSFLLGFTLLFSRTPYTGCTLLKKPRYPLKYSFKEKPGFSNLLDLFHQRGFHSIIISEKTALENSFSIDMKFAGTKEGGDMSRSPHAAPALSDYDVAPVRELSHRGSHSGGGESPLSV